MRKLLLVLAVLGLAACTETTSVLQGGTSFTAPIANPVGFVDIYRTKNVFAATRTLMVEYREYCWARPYADLMKDVAAKFICLGREKRVLRMQAADLKAEAAIAEVDAFVVRNPTVSAVSLASAAWRAVTNYQSVVAQNGVTR